MVRTVKIRHWLPIITFCPVNSLPDLIYVTLEFEEDEILEIHELYDLRRQVRKLVSGKKMFMEDIAYILFSELAPTSVTVRLLFNRHVVTMSHHGEE